MTPPQPLYAIVTVRCTSPVTKPLTDREAYESIKASLGLKSGVIDDIYGAVPAAKVNPWMEQQNAGAYLVLIQSQEAFRLWQEKHPNIIGIHHAAVVPAGKGPQPLSQADIQKIKKPGKGNCGFKP